MFSEYPDLLATNDVQKALGIGRTKTYELINDGTIRHIRIGKSIKIPKQFLIDFVSQACYNTDVAIGSLPCQMEGLQQ